MTQEYLSVFIDRIVVKKTRLK